MSKGILHTCVDPRLHGIADELTKRMNVDAAYNCRYGGPDGILVQGMEPQMSSMVAETKRFMGLTPISAIAVCGHTTCAGHDVTDDEHREHTREAAKKLRAEAAVPETIPVLAFLAVRGASDTDWSIEDLGTF